MEVDEGRWGRSEGQIGSMPVTCKSAWLLHFAAALPIIRPQQLDNSTSGTGLRRANHHVIAFPRRQATMLWDPRQDPSDWLATRQGFG